MRACWLREVDSMLGHLHSSMASMAHSKKKMKEIRFPRDQLKHTLRDLSSSTNMEICSRT